MKFQILNGVPQNIMLITEQEISELAKQIEKMEHMSDKAKRAYIIDQYDLDGTFIKRWDSATEINRQTGYLKSNILRCCHGKTRTAYGYKWLIVCKS